MKDAVVEIRAPLKISKKQIDEIITSKLSWIESNQKRALKALEGKKSFAPSFGDFVLFRGVQTRIVKSQNRIPGFEEGNLYLPDGLSPEAIRLAAIDAYKKAAKLLFARKVEAYSKIIGVKPAAVKVNSAKTRWGSCSGKNSINFSWRLVMAEDDVIDYVVIHELAHIIHHNHSPSFWFLVQSVMPDYAAKREKLNHLQQRIERENWD